MTAARTYMLAVEVDDLGKRFGAIDAVRGLSLHIPPGEIFGLLGPNGAGKTTTLSMLSTVLAPSRGRTRIFGLDPSVDVRSVRALIGLVPQDVALYPNLTARENLRFFGRLYGVRAQDRRARETELLELVGLAGRADDRVHAYSGGMKRRLNLACGLVHRPRLLLLDEPTVGVDPQSRDHILDAVLALARNGTTIVYTTHYLEEAERVCDRIAIMDEGRVAAVGTLPELLAIVGMGEVIDVRGALARDPRIREVPGVMRVEEGDGVTRLFVASAGRALGPIAGLLAASPGGVEALEVHPADLRVVFMHLTGKALRD